MTAARVEALKKVWKDKVSQKVKLFVWSLLHDRIPTRCQLARIRIITNEIDKLCVLCNELPEDADHIMWNCKIVQRVGQLVFDWLGMNRRFYNNQHVVTIICSFWIA